MEELMALQDGHREAGLAARMAFAVWFDHFRLKKMIVLHIQVEASRTFLMVEIDRRVDKLGGEIIDSLLILLRSGVSNATTGVSPGQVRT